MVQRHSLLDIENYSCFSTIHYLFIGLWCILLKFEENCWNFLKALNTTDSYCFYSFSRCFSFLVMMKIWFFSLMLQFISSYSICHLMMTKTFLLHCYSFCKTNSNSSWRLDMPPMSYLRHWSFSSSQFCVTQSISFEIL